MHNPTTTLTWLKSKPDNYRAYGFYWWSIKRMLREEGANLGTNDDPEVRKMIERMYDDDDDLMLVADHYANRMYGQNAHYHTLPNGEEYYIHDSDMDGLT